MRLPSLICRDRQELRGLAQNIRLLYDKGLNVIPVVARGKQPQRGFSIQRPFRNADAAIEYLKQNRDTNFGVVTGPSSSSFVLDVDGDEGRETLCNILTEQKRRFPPTVAVSTPNGLHIYFDDRGEHVRSSVRRLGPGLDIRGLGGYVVAAGSIGENGVCYRYQKRRGLHEVPIAKAPGWLLERINKRESTTSAAPPAMSPAYGPAALQKLCDEVISCSEGSRNNGLNRAAFKCGQLVSTGQLDHQTAEAALLRAASLIELGNGESLRTILSGLSAGAAQPRTISVSTLPAFSTNAITERLSKLGTTEIDTAKRFSERYGDEIAFTNAYGWLKYIDGRWKGSADPYVLACAMNTAKWIEDEARFKTDDAAKKERSDLARRSSSRHAIENMMRLAQPALSKEDSTFDRNKMLLNVANGTIDLKTGELRSHDPRDCITKISPIDFDPHAKAPVFSRFLRGIMREDRHSISYLQRVFGYCLTGETKEQKFFFIVGPGGTGKSVLTKVLRALAGEYAVQSDMRTFLVKQYDNEIPEDIARLHGVRVAVAAEANVDRQIDEAKIKTLTGQDPIVARRMRQNSFQFEPEFKLLLVANHFPRVREAGDAFWRRVQVIPMERRLAEDEVDHQLSEKLMKELPGILAWALRGCLEWQRVGLQEPLSVSDATQRWQGFADTFTDFLKDQCLLDPSATVSSSRLFETYCSWCQSRGAPPLSVGGFKIKLQEKNLNHRHTNSGNIWGGIRLMSSL